ncbi:hypothetical protein AB3X82_23345 [Paraburkholderia phenoliruptrix]
MHTTKTLCFPMTGIPGPAPHTAVAGVSSIDALGYHAISVAR